MTVFLTGGTGFVGSHLAEALLARGAAVRALVRTDARWLRGQPVQTVRGDLFDVEALREGLRGADVVFHIAGLTRAPDAAALERANVEGTVRLLDAAAEALGAGSPLRRVVVTSSLAAVGPSGATPLTEAAPLRPISAYGRSKARMEAAVAAHALAPYTTVVRPPAVYGPRETDIFTMIRTADRQRVFPVVGDGRTPRLDLVYVRDLVAGLLAAAEAEAAAGETFFLGGAHGYAWDEIHAAVAEALGHRVLRVPVAPVLVRPIGALVEGVGRLAGRYPPLNREKAAEAAEAWLASSAKAARLLGYAPAVSLREGMRETVAWYRAEGWL
ncbi:MAG: NAD-dependent epimerase/dehydratase family protein [Rubricoccaceae bacterium]